MKPVGWRLAGLTAVVGSLVLTTPASAAAPIDNAATALRTDSVYSDPAASRTLDVNAVRRAIGTAPIKIAIIPRIESVSEVATLPRRLARDLPGNTIAVISGRYFYAGSEVICAGLAGKAATNAINTNEQALDEHDSPDSPSDITKPLTDFVAEVKAAPTCPTDGTRGDRYADAPGGGFAATGTDDTSAVLPFVLTGIGVGVLVIGTLALLTLRRARQSAVVHRNEASALVLRLGAELDDLPSAATGQAGHDRAEAIGRHGEAEAILTGATTDAQFATVRRTAIQGLHAARAARVGLGGEPGPAIPDLGEEVEPNLDAVRVSGEAAATETRR
jgi:hypothetical protein